MPRRSTHYYTSENAKAPTEEKIYIYYCKYSGKHAMTTDVNIETLPRRDTDNAYILDTEEHTVKLYTADGGVKLLRRAEDKVERQYRLHVGPLPVAYKTELEGRFIYILDDALSTFDNAFTGKGVLVPPCITSLGEGRVQVLFNFEESLNPRIMQGLNNISSDECSYTTRVRMNTEQFHEDIMEFFTDVFQKRRNEIKVNKGITSKSRFIVVENTTADIVYKQLQETLTYRKAKFEKERDERRK